MIGPPFQNEICSIMLHFHFHAIALSTDIEKVFLHVNLDGADRDYTRFLWLSEPSDPKVHSKSIDLNLFCLVQPALPLY